MANAVRTAEMPRTWFIGTYAGTTAAQKINIGFKPSLVIAVNMTDADTIYIWSKTDVAQVIAITTAVATSATAITQVDDGTNLGISLPSDAVVNENAKTYVFIAFPE